nr:hypothetical protein [Tanacetum cinerariifolium]
MSSKTLLSSAMAGAEEATDEGITNEIGRDSMNHFGDDSVPTCDYGVWTGAGETLTSDHTRAEIACCCCRLSGAVSSSSKSVPLSSDSLLFVYVFAINSKVPWYLFRKGRVGDDGGDDDDKGVSMQGSSGKGVCTGEPQALPVDEMVSVSVRDEEEDNDLW